jgi:beta-glucosidase
VDFVWGDRAPDPSFDDDDFGVRWTGVLVPPATGRYLLGGEGFNGFRISLADKLLAQYDGTHQVLKTYGPADLEVGKSYPLTVEFFHRSRDARMRLLWAPPDPGRVERAVQAARKADAVVMCLGLSPRLEGEEMDVPVEGFRGGDRLTLDLPALQEDILRRVTEAAAGKPVVLVLLNGSALAINWAAEKVPAIVEAWYPGQAAGAAIADVLFGEYNPGGRLPVTFYRSVKDLPAFGEYRMVGQTYRYFRGEPLYPFGFGLSYTRFTYSNLRLPREAGQAEAIEVKIDVANSGSAAGEEVVQLYIQDVEASFPVPVRALQGFRRVVLAPGETKTVAFILEPRAFSVIDGAGRWVVEPGDFLVSVGGKQPGFRGHADAQTTQVLTGRVAIRGPAQEMGSRFSSGER